ncbi:hypothetical protein ACN42_g11928, partial [Penicillium freii]
MRFSIVFTLSAIALANAQSSVSIETVDNPATQYLTQTNSLGVVTGQPDAVTTQPTAVTSQVAAVTS